MWIYILIILLIIILSPVTYSILGKIVRWTKKSFIGRISEEDKIIISQEIHQAIDALAQNEKGATIVVDLRDETKEYVTDAENIDSLVSSNLIVNIFEGSKTPLHDGAIIINGDRITKASAYITKLSEQEVPKKFGTRHRSALGLAEVTKAIIIVLSEETGTVKIFNNSKWEDINTKDLFGRVVELWGVNTLKEK